MKSTAKRWIPLGRRALFASLCTLWFACLPTEEGDIGSTHTCPPGETCVPNPGLRFSGQGLDDARWDRDAGLFATAVGGTQRMQTLRLDDSECPFGSIVTSDDESVLLIESQDWTGFIVRAVSEGTAVVRVTDSAGRLCDRITLSTAAVASVVLRRRATSASPDLDWAFFRNGGEQEVVFALESASGERLIDDSAMPIESANVVPLDWQHANVTVPADGDELSLPIRLGSGEVRYGSAPLVGEVDGWTRTGWTRDLVRAPSVGVGVPAYLCYLPLSGSRAVAAAPFELSTEGPIDASVGVTGETSFGSSCATITGLEPGDATLIVRGAVAELRQPLRVVSP